MSNRLIEHILLPLGDLLLGTRFMGSLREMRGVVQLPEDELAARQMARLKAILVYSQENVPYYKVLSFPLDADPIQRLKAFPILDKTLLHQHQEDLLALPRVQMLRQSSSGSSGVQSVVYWTKAEQDWHRATQIMWWEWAGYHMGMPILQTGMTPQRGWLKGLKDMLLSTYYYPAFVPSEAGLHKAFAWASCQKQVFLGGYASSLYVLSRFAREHDKSVHFQSAVSWGDKLFNHYKQSIESVFSTQVYETYGSAEGMMIAAQKDLPYMYIMTPNVYLELLDDAGNEVPDGEIGHVVVTSLVAKGMPLIRYKIGDLAIKLPRNDYPQKRELALPLLQKVVGRDTDLVKTPSGKYMVVHTFTGIFEHIHEIEQFKIIQDNLSGITIQYIPRKGFHPDILNAIEAQIRSHLQEDFFIHFQEVNHLLPSPSGKQQIIESRL